MNKKFQLATIFMVILGVIGTPMVYAGPMSDHGDDDKEKILDSDEVVKEKVLERDILRNVTKRKVIEREELFKKKKFRELKKEGVGKLEKLGDMDLRRLDKLEKWKLKKLSRMDERKLAKLAKLEHGQLRKIAGLQEDELDRLSELDEATLKKIGRLSRAEIKRFAMKSSRDLARIDFGEEINKRDDFRKKAFIKRKIAKDRMEEAREDFKMAEGHRMKAKNQFGKARTEFFDAKNAIAACEGVDSKECDELREKIRVTSKAFLLQTSDIVIAELEKTKAKIEGSEDLSEEEVTEWVASIDAKISEIEDTKTTIKTAETKAEIIEAAKTLKGEWLFTKQQTKKLIGLVAHRKAGGIIAKSEILEERLEEILSDLEEKGVDTTEIDALVDKFSEKVAEARDEYDLAQEKWVEAGKIRSNYTDVTAEDLKNVNVLLREAEEHVKAANVALKEAHAILKKIVKLVKVTGVYVTDPNKPDYTPGEDLGYFIWQTDGNAGVWTICLSGDAEKHAGKGAIKADSGFGVVRPFLYEMRTDKYIILDTEIIFRDRVVSHQDCLRFGTASEDVTFELYIDGEQTDKIFVGKDGDQYSSPVTLKGEPCAECVDEPEAPEVEEGYELIECTTSGDCTEEKATCSEDSVCVVEEEEEVEE